MPDLCDDQLLTTDPNQVARFRHIRLVCLHLVEPLQPADGQLEVNLSSPPRRTDLERMGLSPAAGLATDPGAGVKPDVAVPLSVNLV